MERIVLHVDDSEDEIVLFRRAFERSLMEGWRLQSALGGRQALEYLSKVKVEKTPKPALVLVDLKMPTINGFEVLTWLKGNLPEVPAAVLSSSELNADRLKASELGAVAYVPKGATFKHVIEFVQGRCV
jgi:CheY-like chemotaxis protein